MCHFYSCLWHVSGIALCPLFSNKYKQKHWRQRTYTANINKLLLKCPHSFSMTTEVSQHENNQLFQIILCPLGGTAHPLLPCQSCPQVHWLACQQTSENITRMASDQINNDSRDFTLNTFLSQPSPINRDLVENIHCWHSRVFNLFGSTALTEKQLN